MVQAPEKEVFGSGESSRQHDPTPRVTLRPRTCHPSSRLGHWVAPRPGVVVYNASKGAVVTLTRGLAVELAPDRIRVNAVNPVAADTAFMQKAVGVHPLPAAVKEQLVRGIPLGRLTEPRDVAACVLFLASSDAEFLTGVCLDVDGGRSIS